MKKIKAITVLIAFVLFTSAFFTLGVFSQQISMGGEWFSCKSETRGCPNDSGCYGNKYEWTEKCTIQCLGLKYDEKDKEVWFKKGRACCGAGFGWVENLMLSLMFPFMI